MSKFEIRQLEKDLRIFTARHFDKSSRCKNLVQIQFYLKELTLKIEEFKIWFNYVPDSAYTLLSDYNAMQNKFIFRKFRRSYSW